MTTAAGAAGDDGKVIGMGGGSPEAG